MIVNAAKRKVFPLLKVQNKLQRGSHACECKVRITTRCERDRGRIVTGVTIFEGARAHTTSAHRKHVRLRSMPNE
jgi:hypothetical protein